uniref:Uncharacterized protein n=1 Tax=Arundo donax TaxID=35708 RepID=A0A0A8ZFW2_ARUDO
MDDRVNRQVSDWWSLGPGPPTTFAGLQAQPPTGA